MARIYKDTKIYHGSYDISGHSNSYALDYTVDEKRATVFGSGTELAFPGLAKVGANVEGLMSLGDLASGTYIEPIIWARIGNETDQPHGVGSAATDGARCFFFRALDFQGGLLEGSVGDLQPFKFKISPSAARLVAGKIGLAKSLRTGASGNGTGYQLGAVTADQKLYAALFVFGATGTPSVVVKIQSDDNASFTSATDRITFTTFTDKTSEWKEVAGAITDTYWRVTFARTGGTDFTAAVMFGIGPA